MKKNGLFAILALSLLFTGCGGGVKLTEIDKSYSTDTSCAEVKIPQLGGLSSKELQKTVNEEYAASIGELLDNFSESAKNTGDRSEFETETTVHCNENGLFSAVTEVEASVRSAYKNSFRITKNIDTRQCIELELSDLFADDAYIDMLNSRIDEEIKTNSDKYTDLWAKPCVSPNQRFYVNSKYLVLFYPPYELSYYERGFVEIPLSLSDMSGYLKPEYRALSGN